MFSALAARAGADAATPIDSAALARDKAARRIEAALARARAAGVPDAERYTPRPHAEQPRAVDGVGVSRCCFAGVVSKLFFHITYIPVKFVFLFRMAARSGASALT